MAFKFVDTEVSTIRKYSKIRYDKKLNKEIDDTLRRYNNKITRLARQRSNYILPQKVSKDDLMEVSYTRRDLQRRLSNLRKFNERGAERSILTSQGYAISKYELDYLKREQSRVKRKINKEIKRYETVKPTVFGKEQSRTFAQMGDTNYLNALARLQAVSKDITSLTQEQLIDYRKLLYSAGKNRDYLAESFKLGYLDMLTQIGYNAGYDYEKLELLRMKLQQLEPDKFYDLYRNEKSIKAVSDYYYVISDGKFDTDEFSADISRLYDNLLESIDAIIKDYK